MLEGLKARIATLLTSLFRRGDEDAALQEELRFHLAEETRRNLAAGAGEDEARRAARLSLGGEQQIREACRDEQGVRVIDALGQDVRYGLRMLRRTPGLTAVVVLTLALGIGANTAIFGLVWDGLLRPFDYADPERLCLVWEDASHYGFPMDTPSPGNFSDWREQANSFKTMAALAEQRHNLAGLDGPEQLDGFSVTAGFFPLLGIAPEYGRWLDESAPTGARIAVISRRLAERQFGEADAAPGQTLNLDGETYSVAGVLPRDFVFLSTAVDVWTPLEMTQEQWGDRRNHFLTVVGRLEPTADLQSAQSEMDAIAGRLALAWPQTNANVGVVVQPLRDHLVGDVRPALMLLLGAVGLVLLITCANVANLLLARGGERGPEMALRAALGAGRGRLVGQLVIESLLIAGIGGVLGLVVAHFGGQAIAGLLPQPVLTSGLSAPVMAFALVLTLMTGLLFGSAPAWRLAATGVARTGLNSRGTIGGGGGLYHVLIVGEVALALVLLVAGGLVTRSFVALQDTSLGFDPSGAVTLRTELLEDRYADHVERSAFLEAVLERVRAIPSVESAGFISHLPLVFDGQSAQFDVEGGAEPPAGRENITSVRVVTPGYVDAMAMRIVAGRDVAASDREQAQPVVMINERLAEMYFGGTNPLEQRIRLGYGPNMPWMTVVGVVADVRQWRVDAPPRAEVYLPHRQFPLRFAAPRDLVVRAQNAESLVSTVTATVREVAPSQPITRIGTLAQIVDGSLTGRALQWRLFGGFAILGLVLALVGIYGLISYQVAQRTREIGLRVALGARRRDVLLEVIRRGVTLTTIGLAIGLVAARLLTGYLDSVLYEVPAADPATFAVMASALLVAALMACWLPAWRATRIDPMVALRSE